jgi:hypothetical protein
MLSLHGMLLLLLLLLNQLGVAAAFMLLPIAVSLLRALVSDGPAICSSQLSHSASHTGNYMHAANGLFDTPFQRKLLSR